MASSSQEKLVNNDGHGNDTIENEKTESGSKRDPKYSDPDVLMDDLYKLICELERPVSNEFLARVTALLDQGGDYDFLLQHEFDDSPNAVAILTRMLLPWPLLKVFLTHRDGKSARIQDFPWNYVIRDRDLVRLKIARGGDVNSVADPPLHDKYFWKLPPDDPDLTPLILAVQEAGLVVGKDGKTAIEAGRTSSMEIPAMLLDAGADINGTTRPSGYGTAILEAMHSRHTHAVKFLKARGADIAVRAGRYHSALHVACLVDDAKTARLLLRNRGQQQFDIEEAGGVYGTPLQAACAAGAVSCVKLLLDTGAQVHHRGGGTGGSKYATALHAAASLGSTECVQLLIDKGAYVNAPGTDDDPGVGPLYLALDGGKIDAAELLVAHGAHLLAKPADDQIGALLLVEACERGNPALVRRLVGDEDGDGDGNDNETDGPIRPAKLDVNSLVSDDRRRRKSFRRTKTCTPLVGATLLNKDPEVARLLLRLGAKPNLRQECDLPALVCAIRRDDAELVRLLLEAGAGVRYQPYGDDHMAVLAEAARHNGTTEIAQLLVDAGADSKAVTLWGQCKTTALHEALQNDSRYGEAAGLGHIQLLVHHGGDVHARNDRKCTVLDEAARLGRTAAVELLVRQCGAAVDLNVISPLHGGQRPGCLAPVGLAAEAGHPETVRKLLELGTDPNIRAGQGLAVETSTFAEYEERFAAANAAPAAEAEAAAATAATQEPLPREGYMNETAWQMTQSRYAQAQKMVDAAAAREDESFSLGLLGYVEAFGGWLSWMVGS